MLSLFLSSPTLQFIYLGLFVIGVCHNASKTNSPNPKQLKNFKSKRRERKNKVFKNRILSPRKLYYTGKQYYN